MLDIPDTKPFIESLFRPAARRLARAKFTANGVTVAGMALSLATGACALAAPGASWPLFFIVAMLLLRLAFNHIDGLLAREHDMETPLGLLLNETATPIEDAALYLPLAAYPGMPAALIVAAVLVAAVAEIVGLGAVAAGAERRRDGPMTKVARGLVFGGLALALAVGIAPGPWVDIIIALTIGLLVVTALNRLGGAVVEVSL